MRLELKSLSKSFWQSGNEIPVLKNARFQLEDRQTVAVVGASGVGKSTLLHCCGLLDLPDDGEILIDGQSVQGLTESRRTKIRQEKIGFVFQFHYLMSELTALENVALPLMVARKSQQEAQEAARHWLNQVGLVGRMEHLPKQLSGGEQQRVAIARALVHEPSLVLADEPTGNLDPKTAQQVFDVMIKRVQDLSSSFLMVTHNLDLAQKMDRRLTLEEGALR